MFDETADSRQRDVHGMHSLLSAVCPPLSGMLHSTTMNAHREVNESMPQADSCLWLR